MRALTVRQPWAWAIIHGGKDVENRTRNVAGAYRGPVAIHAGLTPDTAAQGYWPPRDLIPREAWAARGVYVGVVDLVDVHLETPRCCTSSWAERVSRYDDHPIHHLVLEHPRPLTQPLPARGMLGLWSPTDNVAAALLEA